LGLGLSLAAARTKRRNVDPVFGEVLAPPPESASERGARWVYSIVAAGTPVALTDR